MTESDVEIHPTFLAQQLKRAIMQGHARWVPRYAKLLETLNEKDKEGNTFLHFAARVGQKSSLVALLNLEADPTIENHRHKTPAMVARDYGHSRVFSEALEESKSKRLRAVYSSKHTTSDKHRGR